MENCLYLFVSCTLPRTAAVCDCYKHNWYITYDGELFVSVCILYPPQDGGGVWLLQTQLIHYVRWRIVCICLYLVPSLWRRRCVTVTNTIDTLRTIENCLYLFVSCSLPMTAAVCDCYKHNWYITYDRELFVSCTLPRTTAVCDCYKHNWYITYDRELFVSVCILYPPLWQRRCIIVTNTIDTLRTMENCLYLSVSCRPTLPRTAAVCDCYKHNWYITYDGELFVSVRILYPP